MAAVIATRRGYSPASCVIASPNTLVHCGGPAFTGRSSPVTGSYGARAWYFSVSGSGSGKPLPFSVITCTTRGPLSVFTISNACTIWAMLWPSIGPKYRKPSSSNSIPGDQRFLMLSSIVFAKSTSFCPPTMWETDSIRPFTRSRMRTVIGLAMIEPRYLLMAPTFGAIDIPLSFSTMMMSRPECPALFIAS